MALQSGANALVAIVMGVVTATFGGLARDVVCGETPLILRKEVYATCTMVGAAMYVTLYIAGVPSLWAVLGGFCVGFFLRAGGIAWGWTLPTYKTQPGREYD